MNEVNSARGNQLPQLHTASSKAGSNQNSSELGKELPPIEEVDAAAKVESVDTGAITDEQKPNKDADSIDDAVASMNDFVQSVQRDLQFSVDEELDRTVVKVLDSASGEVIRQIPEQTFLELARNMKEHGELHLIDATG